MTMRWYVVHTYSGFEKQVVRSLKEHIRNTGMEEKFAEILVPTEEVVEMKSGQKRTSERKFFPGYVLVKMEMDDETWHLVKDVPKVSGLSAVPAPSRRRLPTRKRMRFCGRCRKAWRNRARNSRSWPASRCA